MNPAAEPGSAPFIAPEYAFAVIGLVFGLMLVYINPPWQSNDEDRHFYSSFFYATGQSGRQQNGDQVGGLLPVNLFNVATQYQAMQFSPTSKLSKARVEQSSSVPLNEAQTMFYNNPNAWVNPLGYLPSVAGIWISKAVSSNPLHLLWGARIFGLLTYLAIVFAAIRTIPIHKWVLFTVALTPMVLYQAASVTYDTLCIALAYLILALIVRFAMRETPVPARELMLFFVVLIVHRHVKEGYFLLPFLFLLVPRKNIGSNAKMAAILLFLCALCFLPSQTWDAYLASLNLHGGAPLQNDFVFDARMQLDFYRQQPLNFVWYILLNMVNQSKEWMIGAVGRFGYAYVGLAKPVVFMHVLVLLTLSVLDSSPLHSLTQRQRLLAAVVGLGSIALIIVGFFAKGSPVGAHILFGLQGRYFIPMLPLLLLINHNAASGWGLPEKWKSVGVPIYCVCLLGYSLNFINDYFYRA